MNRSTLLLLVALVLAAFGHAADNSEAIIQATKDYVKKQTAVKDPLVTVQKVADGYARVQVKIEVGRNRSRYRLPEAGEGQMESAGPGNRIRS
jgi:predicted RND superfamily exporter protein